MWLDGVVRLVVLPCLELSLLTYFVLKGWMMKLIPQLRKVMRQKRYAATTEKSYVYWVKSYIRFHDMSHPDVLGAEHITAFLNNLAEAENVAASTQNQALCALVFFYKYVLKREPGELEGLHRANRPRKLPTVLSCEEVSLLFDEVDSKFLLHFQLLYGSGMRLSELLRLRIKDVDFNQRLILIRAPKERRDRKALLPDEVLMPLREQIEHVRHLHFQDMRADKGYVQLPFALARKYPNAASALAWQYVFPASRYVWNDERKLGRHHMHGSSLQRAIKKASARAGLRKSVGCHTLRHCFATHLLEQGVDIRTIQQLLGHRRVQTTMIYTHVANKPLGFTSPLSRLLR